MSGSYQGTYKSGESLCDAPALLFALQVDQSNVKAACNGGTIAKCPYLIDE